MSRILGKDIETINTPYSKRIYNTIINGIVDEEVTYISNKDGLILNLVQSKGEKREYTYNNKGNLITSYVRVLDKKSDTFKIENSIYRYDEKDRLIYKMVQDNDNKCVYCKTIEYNSEGIVFSEIVDEYVNKSLSKVSVKKPFGNGYRRIIKSCPNGKNSVEEIKFLINNDGEEEEHTITITNTSRLLRKIRYVKNNIFIQDTSLFYKNNDVLKIEILTQKDDLKRAIFVQKTMSLNDVIKEYETKSFEYLKDTELITHEVHSLNIDRRCISNIEKIYKYTPNNNLEKLIALGTGHEYVTELVSDELISPKVGS